jgi:hypothetical protein
VKFPFALSLSKGALALALVSGAAHAEGFTWRVDLLGVGEYFDAADGSSQVRALTAVRPDMKFQTEDWLLVAKPRAELEWVHLQDAPPGVDDDEAQADAFVHEAFVRWRPVKGLYVQAGRENLQWGPAYLLSVSNPFIQDNGRNNPTVEVPGLDYGRVTWIASPQWTLGAIANVNEGKLEHVGTYPQQFALKLDYNGGAKYFSLIPSWREPTPRTDSSRDFGLGAYGGWSVSEAFLAYVEGAYRHLGSDFSVLGGGAYTFVGGTNVALEYYYNDAGCPREPYALCFPVAPTAAVPSRDATLYGLTRRHYVLLQVLEHSRLADWDFTLRWIQGLDDGSGQLIGIVEYDASRNLRLYAIGAGFFGGSETEYGSVLDGYASVGVKLSF